MIALAPKPGQRYSFYYDRGDEQAIYSGPYDSRHEAVKWRNIMEDNGLDCTDIDVERPGDTIYGGES